jgi:long-subunit fatty acid transport protein
LGLKDNNYTGFRLGAQYKLDDKTMLGFNYRSEVNFAATGTSQLIVATPAGAASSSYGSGTAHTTFPMSATLGAQHEFSDTWTGLVEYNWTQYSRNGQINFDSSIASLDGSTLKLNWLDQHTLRLGADYHGFSWPIRYGLSYISQVTDSSDARANLVAPGPAYGVTLGTGHAFDMGGNTLRVDGALEYETVSGDGNGAASGTTSAGSDVRAGSYATTATAVHLGASYTF